MQKDLTQGGVFKTLVSFSAPFLLAYFLQTFYGLADLFIIGQYTGAPEITAVAVGSQVMHMLTVMVVGLAMGTTVMIGRAVGGKDYNTVGRTIGNSIVLFGVLSLVACLALLTFVDDIVSLMSTPPESVEQTRHYLTICFVGVPLIVAYNIISSIFRGLGDSKSPMYFVAIACVMNVLLDYLLIGVMGMKAEGAAYATVIAQLCSVLFSAGWIRRNKGMFHFGIGMLRVEGRPMKNILQIGLPISLQDGFIQVSFIVITVIANRRGVEVAAAVGIVEKIICILFLVPSSMLSAISAIAAQNIGAGKPERARATLRLGIFVCLAYGFLFSSVLQPTSDSVISWFTDDSNVILFGGQYLRPYSTDCALAGVHFCFSGYFCACGMSIVSFIHNLLSIVLIRIPGSYYASIWYPDNLTPMGMAAPLGSLLSVAICVGVYIYYKKKK